MHCNVWLLPFSNNKLGTLKWWDDHVQDCLANCCPIQIIRKNYGYFKHFVFVLAGISHVVNYDMPLDIETYVHRIGRTGRAGACGISVSFWNAEYDSKLAHHLVDLAKLAGQTAPLWLENCGVSSLRKEEETKQNKKYRKELRRAQKRRQQEGDGVYWKWSLVVQVVSCNNALNSCRSSVYSVILWVWQYR